MRYSFQDFPQKKLTLILLIILFLPLILWGGFFLDDVRRAHLGQYAWSGDYRPIMDFIYYFLGQGVDFVDFSPFNYLMQFGLLYIFIPFASQRYLQKVEIEEKYLNYIILCWFFVFSNPFFLQNLYFRYDSLPMVISIALISMPFIIKQKKWWFDFTFLILVLFLYQPTVVGYVILTCLEMVILARKNKEYKIVIRYLFFNILSLILAFIVFKLIANYILEANVYAAKHFMFLGVDQIDKILENILFSVEKLVFTNSLSDQIIILVILTLSITYAARTLLSKYSYKLGFLFLLAFILVVALSVINPNIFLYYPRLYARVYVAIGFFSFLILMLLIFSWLNEENKLYEFICKFLVFYLLVLNINIVYSTFNAMRDMQKHEEFIANSIMQDISSFPVIRGLEFFGAIDKTARFEILAKKYSVIHHTMESKINSNHNYYIYYILGNYGFEFDFPRYQNENKRKQRLNMVLNQKPYLQKRHYNIYYFNSDVVILFKEKGEIPLNIINRNRLT